MSINLNLCVLAIQLALLIFSTFFKKKWLPYLLIIYGCTSAFLYNFIFMLLPFKLFFIWCPALILFLGFSNKSTFLAFWFLIASISFAFLINLYDVLQINVVDGQVGNLKPWARSLFNTLLYVASLLLIPLVSSVINSYSNIVNLVRFYLVATTILCVYGMYQVVAYYFQLPLRPIWYGNSAESIGLPIFSLMGMPIFRIYSLCSEPKILASVLLPAVFLLALPREYLNIIKLKPLTAKLLCVLHFAVVIGTFSTSTSFSLIACCIYFCVLFLFKSKRFIFGALVLSFIIILSYFGFIKGSQIEVVAQKTYEVRISDKINKEDIVEKKIINFMYRKPYRLLFGLGAGNIYYILRNEDGKIPEFSNMGILILAAEFGLLGIVAWACFFLKIVRSNIAALYPPNPYQKLELILKMIFVISFISYFFRENIFPVVFASILIFSFRRIHLVRQESVY